MTDSVPSGVPSVAVLGFGAMGAGIAQVCAQTGRDVIVLEADERRLADGRARLAGFLDGGVRRGKMTAEERDAVLDRVRGTIDLADLAGAGVVVEAVSEDADVKRDLLARVTRTVPEEALIATNTSALSVTGLAAAVPRPDRFAGLHFFNPAPLMPLVEVIRALQTSEDTVTRLTDFAEAIGKTPLVVEDRPGFLVNRLLMPYLNDVVQAYDDGLASARDIDTALELGLGYPMGPLRLLDLIGMDVHAHATGAAYEATHDPALAPPPLLTRMVEAGYLGRKAGRGFRTGAEEGDQ
ncbi:MAG: 3-hydroxyacyl-CoA dehydrogenase family protein [Streptosporangiaceae bacterium]